MMKRQFIYFAAVLFMGACFVACSSKEEAVIEQPVLVVEDGWHVSIQVSKGGDITRALSEVPGAQEGSAGILATWSTTDKIAVFKNGNQTVGTLNPATDGSRTATLSGTLTGNFQVGDKLYLTYLFDNVHKPSYFGQNGTLSNIADNFDYAQAEVTITAINEETHTLSTTEGVFENLQAICKFNFPYPVQKMTIECGSDAMAGQHGTVSVRYGGSNSVEEGVFVALNNVVTGWADTYAVSIYTTDNKIYVGNFTADLENGKFYPISFNSQQLSEIPTPQDWNPDTETTVLPPGAAFGHLESSGYVERWYPYLGDDGKLYSWFNTPPNVKLIALVVSYECSSGHALAMALDDALSSQWSTVNGPQWNAYHLTCGDSEGSTVPQVCCSFQWNQYPPEHPGYSGTWTQAWVDAGIPAISDINPGDYEGYFYVDYKYLDEWKDGMVNTTNLLHCTGGWSSGRSDNLPGSHEHPAASAACNYNCGATIPGNVVKSSDCSNGWFLPSMWDWTCAVWGIDNQSKNGAPNWDTTFGTINRHLNKMHFTPLKRGTGAENSYWTSCETEMAKASCAYYLGLNDNTKTASLKVRPFLKFTNICGEWYYLVDPAQHQGFDANGDPIVGGN